MASKLLVGQWDRVVSNPRLCRSSQALSVIGQKAYVFGGELLPRQPVDNGLDIVTLGVDSESALKTEPGSDESPLPRVGTHTATLKESLFLFSGRGGLEMRPIEENGAVWRYTPQEGRWDLIQPSDPSAPYPAGRSYHCTASDGSDGIYIHAGCPETGRLADLWRFNVTAKTWTELASAPGPARGGPSIAYTGGKLYRVHGFDGKTEQGGSVDVFDPAANAWSTIAYEPDNVHGPSARSVSALVPVTVGGRTYLVTLFGECDPSALGHAGAGKMLGDVWAFDVEEGTWAEVVSAEAGRERPCPRGWFAADAGTDREGGSSVVVLHGGLAEDNSRLGDVWELRLAQAS